ncbi:MAG: GNAT family N-acetyltransferase [Candidatus Cyclonatronum sp.]|uniref:GNAT family N-acetyltransferase n=1 Tax=Cyclonatronum sp. TaxID=3024185 RepID=UPI0025C1B82F|nr:GNAT family N-acetyltransferase [Cyclonatronum sp.]MCC5932979.1 GNAT family N-acetyltransferase [Balneolales bacterium]MCH8485304.1 GNAT family N-acetyltransferase [Cyclonatronum sp.]
MIVKKQKQQRKRDVLLKSARYSDYTVKAASWEKYSHDILSVRFSVFVHEQKVPIELEVDGFDPVSHHVVVYNSSGKPVATGRLTPDGKLGRMSVLKEYRGKYLGHLLMVQLMSKAFKQGHRIIELSAQTHAIPFYQKYGFNTVGRVYDDAGLPHQKMIYIHK